MHSDEFSGTAVDDVYCAKFEDCVLDPDNAIEPEIANKRPNLPRTLTLDGAIEENKFARLYLGVHWLKDQDSGVVLGEAIAQSIISNFPRRAAGGAPSPAGTAPLMGAPLSGPTILEEEDEQVVLRRRRRGRLQGNGVGNGN